MSSSWSKTAEITGYTIYKYIEYIFEIEFSKIPHRVLK
jgi:hypothetical protein